MLIKNTQELVNFIHAIGTPPYVALDTEFLSEKTYFPQLCLIQIAHGNHAAVIDTLADIDLEPLIQFLMNPKMIKVFHAAEQDLVILWNDFKLSLMPVFDTQIAAMVCGFGDQVSYAQLVKTFTKTRIDKSSQIVDWSKRPLRDRHLEYALADVTHLCKVYERLHKDIDKRGRAPWVAEEMQELSETKRFDFKPEAQARKLKLRNMTPRRMALLHGLVTWREERAKTQNIPRGWVIKDLALRDLVSNPPDNLKDLERARGIGGNAQGRAGQEILSTIKKARELPLSECPVVPDNSADEDINGNAIVLLRALLTHVCDKNNVAPKLVASKSDLEQMTLGVKTRMSGGWRRDLFGGLAERLLMGEISLTLSHGKIGIVHRQ
ncbi:MAG: ribonuclease D [Candidatus Marinimicrobia bacterium]|nr:ribonuclease D [Candidatus Neomarinimicrobiota bacterium]MBT3575054.1 ribonuclease D [Candidatus Neomarinimicrobiota bacterium]MBT3678826.1 ribonuclease D [Candidatus Neomarinimicrobiota bacterium]MBT3949940.1 ribonuclease D [Candidatus Neomarinimicrobiota bacterium]MBT4252643.1 ribonuclease D [Candidatus Neomarinimicrobiota bacterium]